MNSCTCPQWEPNVYAKHTAERQISMDCPIHGEPTTGQLCARISELEAEKAEAYRRRDEWRKKAEGYDEVRLALREKVGDPWPPHMSRVLWAGIAADEKKRADDAEAEVAALREARGGRVKPLVWEDWSARHRTNHTADTPFGRYGVMQFHFPDMHFKIEPPTGKPFIADTIETAKAAAQADYERRILSALEPAPVTPAEAAEAERDALQAKLAVAVEALQKLHHAVCGETGFAECVRRDIGKAYPWPALDIADSLAQTALADAGEAG